MEHDKFQEIMLEHMARLTQELTEIKTSQVRMENKFDEKINALFDARTADCEALDRIEGRLDSMENRLDRVEGRLDRMEGRVDVIFDQTGGLLEFRAETLQRLDGIDGKISILAGEMGKQKLEIELLKKRPV